jgi:hypothetical protein
MTRINRAYVRRLKDLIVQLDSTFSDIESSHTKGYLSLDMHSLHKEADRIRAGRHARNALKKRESGKDS